MPEDIKIRPSARVVLLDDADRLLMLRIHDSSATRGPNPITADFWLLVGGGVQPGDTYEQAAYREVFEETGIRDVSIGPCVWDSGQARVEPERGTGYGCRPVLRGPGRRGQSGELQRP